MAKIKINDLPQDYKISSDEMKRIKGGLLSLTSSKASNVVLNSGNVDPLEEISLNFAELTWEYTKVGEGEESDWATPK